MKLSTLTIAFGPIALILALKFAIEPAWLKETSLLDCLGLGAVMGAFGGIAARILERD
jgi:hypothetical protein